MKYRVEIRRNDDGSLDEVLLYDEERCLFHLEQMDGDHWWFALYPVPVIHSDEDEHFDIVKHKKWVKVIQR